MPVRKVAVRVEDLPLDEKEFGRRLGQSPETLPEGIRERVEKQLFPLLTPVFCYDLVPVRRSGENILDLDFGPFPSGHLTKNLSGCSEAFLFAATIGPGCDRLMQKLEITSLAERFVTDAYGSALAEALAEYANEYLRKEAANEGISLKPRFSPGYGDVSLSIQPLFLNRIDASRQLGIQLTKSNLMIPTKSVTAVIGRIDRAE